MLKPVQHDISGLLGVTLNSFQGLINIVFVAMTMDYGIGIG